MLVVRFILFIVCLWSSGSREEGGWSEGRGARFIFPWCLYLPAPNCYHTDWLGRERGGRVAACCAGGCSTPPGSAQHGARVCALTCRLDKFVLKGTFEQVCPSIYLYYRPVKTFPKLVPIQMACRCVATEDRRMLLLFSFPHYFRLLLWFG